MRVFTSRFMKSVRVVILFGVLSGCSQWTAVQRPANVSEFDAFSLAYHKQFGSCASLPIQHRLLQFELGVLAPEQDNLFFGMLDVLLNEKTLTYEAVYREFPGSHNSDQTLHTETLVGSFQVGEKLVLENIGEVEPTLLGEKVHFTLKPTRSLHRAIQKPEAIGRVIQTETTLRTNVCPSANKSPVKSESSD